MMLYKVFTCLLTGNALGEPVVHNMRDVSLDNVKGTLLSSADDLLSSLSDSLVEWASLHDGDYSWAV